MKRCFIKKLTSVALAILMIFSLLSCGGRVPAATQGTPPVSNQEKPSETDQDQYPINGAKKIVNTDKKVLIDFFATWCGPCRMVSPIVDEIADEHPEFVVCKVDVDNNPELAAEFGVMSIPTLVVIKDGKVINQSAGARPKAQILAMLEG